MAFPTSPVDGQLYTASSGTLYQYRQSDDSWNKISDGDLVILKGASFPVTDPPRERFFYRTDLETLYMWSLDAEAWIDVSSSGFATSGAGATGSNKNAIINGDMTIAQRGTSFVSPGNAAYMLDMWKYTTSLGVSSHTVTQDSDVPTDQYDYSMKFDCTSQTPSPAAGNYVTPNCAIEGYNFKKFVGETATFSFWVKASKAGTLSIAFRNNGADRVYVSDVTIDAINTWEYKTITLTFDYSGGSWNYTTSKGIQIFFGIMCGSTLSTSSTDQWLTGGYLASTNTTNWVESTDDNIWLTGVQLELGDNATDFEFLDYGNQLAMCQRYYQKSWDYGAAPATTTFNGALNYYIPAGLAGQFLIPFKVSMRAQPTLVLYSPIDATVGSVYSNATDGNRTAVSNVDGDSNKSFVLTQATTVDSPIYAHYTLSAEL